MRILIATEGGKDIGFGHVTRCVALAQDLVSRGIIPEIFIRGDDSVGFLLKDISYSLCDWISNFCEFTQKAKTSDCVIIDSYIAPKRLYVQLSRLKKVLLVMIDDYNRFRYPRGIVVNPSLYGEFISYPEQVGVQYLTGKEYIIIRKTFCYVPFKRIRKKISTVLILLGGMIYDEITKRILTELPKYFPKIHFLFLAPERFMIQSRIEQNVKLVKSLDEIVLQKLLSKADLCISGGGQSLYELARCGIPTIAIELARNQQHIISSLIKAGFISYVGNYHNKLLINRIIESFEDLRTKQERWERSRIGQFLIDGYGAVRVNDVIIQTINSRLFYGEISIRPVASFDCIDLWIWSYDSGLRNQYFQKEVMSYNEHVKWFHSISHNPKVKIYIAENENYEKLGCVRFTTLNQLKANINIDLNPSFFNKGLITKIILHATSRYLKEVKNIQSIYSEIPSLDISTVKLFSEADYIFFHYENHGRNKNSIFAFTRAQLETGCAH